MNKLSKLLTTFASAALLYATTAHADGSVSGATVEQVRVTSSGLIEIVLNKTISGRPSCSTAEGGKAMALRTSASGGEAILRMATAAYLSGNTVKVRGTGSCSASSTKEDVDWLRLE